MKLKKVVSLALAGVMAVSMLAGCATGKKPGTGEGEGEGTVTGYSAKFAEYVDEAVTKLDYVTFKDNADDLAAMQDFLGYTTDSEIKQAAQKGFVWMQNLPADTLKKLDATYGLGDFFKTNKDNNLNKTQKIATAYVVDGTMSVDKALKLVADQVNAKLVNNGDAKAQLPEQGKNTADKIYYDYNYVVSVSVVNRATTTLQNQFSANLILVTITRTGTPAKV